MIERLKDRAMLIRFSGPISFGGMYPPAGFGSLESSWYCTWTNPQTLPSCSAPSDSVPCNWSQFAE